MPKYSEPYSNLDEEAPIPLRSIVREIATRTDIRRDIVQEVLDSLTEVATEEIVNKGSFNFNKLFTVSSFSAKETTTTFGKAPARQKISIRLSNTIKALRRLKNNSNELEHETYDELYARRAIDEKSSHKNKNKGLSDMDSSSQNPNRNVRKNDDEWDAMFDDDEY